MTRPSDEEMARLLYDKECIRELKHRYWRLNDLKLMDAIGDCFTEDAVADYAPDVKLEGRQAIVDFLRRTIGREELFSVHQGFNPEIEITGENRARGLWRFYNYLHFASSGTTMRIWGIYEDLYAKVDGAWRIKSTAVTYLRTETTSVS